MGLSILRMYHQARGFQLAAERCLEEHEHPEQKTLPIQAIVNYALSCEIYLKAIYFFEHPDERVLKKHYFDELFYKKIPEEYQIKIQDQLKCIYTKEKIDTYVKEFSKIFEEYRYIYELNEDKREHFGFLCMFASALQNVVGELTHKYVLRLAGMEENK